MSNYTARTFQVFPYFQAGYTVSAYPVTNWPGEIPPSGTPVGTAVSSGTVASDGTVVLRLSAGTHYYLASNGSGSYVYIKAHGGNAVSSSAVTGGVLVASVGDSITERNGSGSLIYPGYGHLTWAQLLSGGRIKYAGHFGTGGYTAQQVRSIKVPLVLAATPKPQYCLVLAGANNEGDADISAAVAAIEGCWTDLRAGGIEPIALSVTPVTGASNAQRTNIAKMNAYIARRSAELGVQFIDLHGALCDTSGGWSSASYTDDNLHPTGAGYKAMAQIISDQLCGPLPSGSYTPLGGPLPFSTPNLLSDNADGLNLIGSNMLFTTDTNSDGLADNMSVLGAQGTPVYQLVTDAAIKGKWQRVTCTGAGGDFTYVTIGQSFNVTPGHRLRFSGRFKVNSIVTAGQAQVFFFNADGSGNLVSASTGISQFTWTGAHPTGGGVFDYEFVVPATDAGAPAHSVSSMTMACLLSGGATDVQFAQMSVVDLTAIGAA